MRETAESYWFFMMIAGASWGLAVGEWGQAGIGDQFMVFLGAALGSISAGLAIYNAVEFVNRR